LNKDKAKLQTEQDKLLEEEKKISRLSAEIQAIEQAINNKQHEVEQLESQR